MNAQIAFLTIVMIIGFERVIYYLGKIYHEIKAPERPEIHIPLTAAQLRERDRIERVLGD
jgi:hypothetical protein